MPQFSEFLLFLAEGYVVMNRIYQGPDKELGLVIRRATCRDVDDLTTIGRLCFPGWLRWRGPRFHTRKWWRAFLDAEYCEAWVCLSHGQVIGFFTFIPNGAQYVEALRKHRPGLLAAFYIFATCPRVFIRKALQKLKLSGTKSLRRLVRSLSNDDKIHASDASRRLSDSQIPWMGSAGVVPSMQGRGVGTEIYKFCLQRAIELGYKEVRASVERGNTRSMGLLKKLGFVITHEGQHMVFYRKTLT
jgi:ribosomal protein S18 acetylase RimI-like enzyme